MKQGELFNEQCEMLKTGSSSDVDSTVSTNTVTTGQTHIDAVTCHKCDITQPIHNFKVLKSGEIKRTCKSCKSGHDKVIYKLRKENPYPDEDYCCPICKRGIEEIGKYGQPRLQTWVLDHCHDSDTFRGWLCSNCNTGLGGFQDNADNVSRAYEYLIKHRMNNGL